MMVQLLEQLPVSTVLLSSIAAAAVLIYFPFGAVAYGRLQVGYDTAAPRALFDKLPPYAQRATWAHQNSFETFTVFAVASLMAYATGQTSVWVAIAALSHVVARFFFSVFYILNIPVGRSLMFGVGSMGTTVLFLFSLLNHP